MRWALALALVLVMAAFPVQPAWAQAAAYRIEPVATGFAHPWSLAFLPDGRLLVTERAGRLRVVERDANGRMVVRARAVEGLPAVWVQGQAGLFDVMVDPDFARNGSIYLSFAHGTATANHLRVVRARFDGARLTDVRELFMSRPAKAHAQHFGGRMALLADGTLAITVGDGNLVRTDAQRLHTHLGKIVRIARDGSVPVDNPFVGRSGALPEIYSTGHRNPQGIVSVAGTLGSPAALYAHEHGARGGDELNRIEPGANYGWPMTTDGIDYTYARVTPYRSLPGVSPPLLHWTPSIAPAGMAYYDGALFPAWRGSLFVAALKERSVRRVPMSGATAGAQETLFVELGKRLRDVRVGPDGAIYLLTDEDPGSLLKVLPAAVPIAGVP